MNTNPIPQAPTGPAPTRAPLPAPDAAARAAWAEAFIAFLLHFASLFARTEAARPDPVQAAVNQAVHELCALIADYAATGLPPAYLPASHSTAVTAEQDLA